MFRAVLEDYLTSSGHSELLELSELALTTGTQLSPELHIIVYMKTHVVSATHKLLN